MTVDELRLVISADNADFRRVMAQTSAEVRKQVSGIQKTVSKLTTDLKKSGSTAGKSFTKGLSGVKADAQKLGRDAGKMFGRGFESGADGVNTTNIFKGIKGAIKGMLAVTAMNALRTAVPEWIKQSNDYVENLNLFNVAMGEGADEALRYAESVQAAMGIDLSQFIRNQGVFKQILSGFGSSESNANLMSKNLTTLGYDISSFQNIGIEEAMLKLQSGITGEIEPLRRLGYTIDEVTLKQTAMSLGFKQNITDMTQSQKSQLRYITIMRQSANAMGDMARTINSPANAMRILEQQVLQLKRALGDLLIPIIMKVLPYVIAFTRVLTDAVRALAALAGFELPEFDSSGMGGVEGGLGDIEDGANDAKKALKGLAGFDELNVLGQQLSDVGDGMGGIGGDLGVELPEYDFMVGLKKQTDEIYKNMKENLDKFKDALEKLMPIIKPIAAALAALWAVGKIIDFINWIKRVIDTLKGLRIIQTIAEWLGGAGTTAGKLLGILGKIGLISFGSWLIFDVFRDNIREALTGTKTWEDALLNIAIVTIPVAAALVALFGPWALVPIAIAAAVGALVGWNEAQKILMEQDLEARFGDISLSIEECRAVAERLTQTDFTMKLGVFVTEKDKLTGMYDEVVRLSELVSKQTWMLSLGVNIDPGEYMANVDSFIAQTQTTLDQQALVASMAVDVGIRDPVIQADMSQFVTSYTEQSKGDLERLGEELRKTVDNAFADGVLDENEMQLIQNLQNEMNEIVSKMADAEYKAKLTALQLDASADGTALTPESFKSIMDEANKIINERAIDLDGVRIENLKLAELKLAEDGDTAAYDKVVKEIQDTFVQNKMDLELQVNSFGTDTLTKAFAAELKTAKPIFQQDMKTIFSEGINAGIFTEEDLYSGSMTNLVNALGGSFAVELDLLDLSGPTKTALKGCLEVLEPTEEDLKTIVAYNKARGIAVPEGVTEGLKDIATLDALAGGVKGVNYLVGDYLSTDKTFLDLLETGKGAGESVDANFATGLITGSTTVSDAVKTGMLDPINAKLTEFETAGQNIFDALKKHLSGEIVIPIKAEYFSAGGTFAPKAYAAGGFPSMGEMFVAREKGPEMVGRIGGRTAVANNDQITSGIASAVYQAFSQANANNGNSGGGTQEVTVHVEIDGDQVGRAVARYNNMQMVRSNGKR